MEEQIKDYLKKNLKINLHYVGDNTVEIRLLLENEEISKDFIHYKNGI